MLDPEQFKIKKSIKIAKMIESFIVREEGGLWVTMYNITQPIWAEINKLAIARVGKENNLDDIIILLNMIYSTNEQIWYANSRIGTLKGHTFFFAGDEDTILNQIRTLSVLKA